jgi:putative endonuclease
MSSRSSPSSSRPRPKPRNRAERRAAWWYRLHGYLVLDTNRWLAGGEIDIVVRRGRTLVFCEVKSKSGSGFGDPLEMVNETKTRRLTQAAEAWLAQHPELHDLEVRFDVIAVRGRRLEHVPHAL